MAGFFCIIIQPHTESSSFVRPVVPPSVSQLFRQSFALNLFVCSSLYYNYSLFIFDLLCLFSISFGVKCNMPGPGSCVGPESIIRT